MDKNTSSVLHMFKKLYRSKLAIGVAVVLVLSFGGYALFGPKTPTYQLVTVTRGAITQTVSVTGNTTPRESVSLGFENSGTIAHVYTSVGNKVSSGRVLAELNTNDLVAQLKQAQASVSIEKAKLEGLKVGAQPEDIAASQAALEKAKQDLSNMYGSIADASTDAFAKANDAVRTQLSPLLSNAETASPKLTFDTSNSQASNDISIKRVLASSVLNKWQSTPLFGNTSSESLVTVMNDDLAALATIRDLLNTASAALDGAINLSAATLATDKANVATAITAVNTATKNLNTIAQNIASQKLTVAQLDAQLALKKSGGTTEDIDAQKAQIEKAEANVASVNAKLQNSRIIAPIDGTITQFDAKVGQNASPGTSLVSIIGDGGFEVHAGIAEADIGKIALENKVTMTIDAFPNETFEGSIFYIAPAETNTQGVVNYEVKISFTQPDPRLKSGLTANLTIITKYKDSILRLPQYALLENDHGTFVQVLESNTIKELPVTLGIQEQSGNVEILSGVSEGDQVLNIGLKKL